LFDCSFDDSGFCCGPSVATLRLAEIRNDESSPHRRVGQDDCPDCSWRANGARGVLPRSSILLIPIRPSEGPADDGRVRLNNAVIDGGGVTTRRLQRRPTMLATPTVAHEADAGAVARTIRLQRSPGCARGAAPPATAEGRWSDGYDSRENILLWRAVGDRPLRTKALARERCSTVRQLLILLAKNVRKAHFAGRLARIKRATPKKVCAPF
jgi:hypothetical protein